jgi:hypothetical protein
LSAIGSFKKLLVLSIENCNSLSDLSPVNELPYLEKLKCIEFPDLEILNTLKDNTRVKSIDILEDRKCFTGFSKTYPNLLTIYFKTQSLTNLKPLESLSNLRCLAMYYCNSITDLKSIEKLSGLNEIQLYNCNNIKGIDKVMKLNNLKIIPIATIDEALKECLIIKSSKK